MANLQGILSTALSSQMQQLQQYAYNTASSNTLWFQQAAQYQAATTMPSPAPKQKRPETALEWLDRRVDEMRVAL